MDPNEALRNCRRIANSLVEKMDADEDLESLPVHKVNQLIESFQGLDQWLSKKGFLPKDWER